MKRIIKKSKAFSKWQIKRQEISKNLILFRKSQARLQQQTKNCLLQRYSIRAC